MTRFEALRLKPGEKVLVTDKITKYPDHCLNQWLGKAVTVKRSWADEDNGEEVVAVDTEEVPILLFHDEVFHLQHNAVIEDEFIDSPDIDLLFGGAS